MDLKRYQKLKERYEKDRRDKDQAKGAFSQLMAELKEQYGVKDLAEAKKLLKADLAEKTKLEQKLDQLLQELEKDYEDNTSAE